MICPSSRKRVYLISLLSSTRLSVPGAVAVASLPETGGIEKTYVLHRISTSATVNKIRECFITVFGYLQKYRSFIK